MKDTKTELFYVGVVMVYIMFGNPAERVFSNLAERICLLL